MRFVHYLSLLLASGVPLACAPAWADSAVVPSAASDAPPWLPMLLGAQYTGIRQHLYPFGAAYSGPLSLTDQGDTATSHTFGAYFGIQLPDHWQAYLDIERFTGAGIGGATGLGSPSNGDVVRAGNGLPKDIYVAKAFVQYLLPLSAGVNHVTQQQDQLPGETPSRAFLFKAGKVSAGDDFDQNRYANSTRTQFESWTLINDGAFDYAADTRGYTDGVVFGYLTPAWSVKFGRYRMPEVANQEALEWPLSLAHSDDLELDFTRANGTVIRLLAYRNVARMGIYDDAIAKAQAGGGIPDIVADDAEGREKHGYGLSLEQPLADSGATGMFVRLGWNDGRTETFAFTESDRSLSFGGQVSGAHWRRVNDRLGAAIAINAISGPHQRYLMLGGCGFELCDGKLDYGYEETTEIYYRVQLGLYAQISPDIQFITNPGYNRDRGPARIAGLRLHLSY